MAIRWLLLGLILGLLGCKPSPPSVKEIPADVVNGPEWFEEVSKQRGLIVRQLAGPTTNYFMPQVMGSGLGVFDADGDGRLDVLILNNSEPTSSHTHRFFRQQADGTFRDATTHSGFDFAGYGMGVACGDMDNDGHVDVYISQYAGGRLLRNRGDATFENVTERAGVQSPLWGTSCCFFDENRDGWLDLVVVNYVDYNPSHACIEASGKRDYCHPNQFTGSALRFYRNRGVVGGTWQGFEDRTVAAGMAKARSNGLGVTTADFNGDGWPDILVANDAQANHLWINQQNGTFIDEANMRNIAYNALGNAAANMGIAVGDMQRKGRFDVFVTHLSEELHTYWHQTEVGQFRDQTALLGLAKTHWRGTGFGTVAVDFDHDGYLDIAVANGRVSHIKKPHPVTLPEDLPKFWHDYAERNQLFTGGPKGFNDISRNSPVFTGTPGVYRGLAWGDMDNDGAVDLVATQIEGPVRLYRNVVEQRQHWLTLRLYDPVLKRDAYGATVRVNAGEVTWLGQCNAGQSYCSSGDPRVHFGLGKITTIDAIDVQWPDGQRERFSGGGVDQFRELKRGTGTKGP